MDFEKFENGEGYRLKFKRMITNAGFIVQHELGCILLAHNKNDRKMYFVRFKDIQPTENEIKKLEAKIINSSDNGGTKIRAVECIVCPDPKFAGHFKMFTGSRHGVSKT